MTALTTINEESFYRYTPPSSSLGTLYNKPVVSLHETVSSKGLVFVVNSSWIVINELSENYVLKKSFRVFITEVDGELTGYIKELDLYSFEDNIEEIIAELKDDIVCLYEDLMSFNNKDLCEAPLEWKRIISEHVERIR